MLERCIVLVFFLSPVQASVNAPACRVPGSDLRNLTKRIWTLKTSEGCLFPEAMNKSSQGICSYYLSFCQMLQIPGNCMNASVCQVLSSNYSIKLGSYARNPFKKDYRAGLKAEFQNGELYNKCKLSMTLNFHCNSNAFWELQNRKKSLQIIPFSESNFHVVFIKRTCQVQYAGACEAVTESPEKEQHHLEGLTVGTILTIMFFCALFLYCSIGVFANYNKGATGCELIPNFEMWWLLLTYSKYGIVFSLNGCKQVYRTPYQRI